MCLDKHFLLYKLPITSYQLQIVNCLLPVAHCQLPVTKWPKNISISSQFSYEFDSIELHSCILLSSYLQNLHHNPKSPDEKIRQKMIKWEQNKYLAFLEEKFGDILKGSKRQVFDPQRHSFSYFRILPKN